MSAFVAAPGNTLCIGSRVRAGGTRAPRRLRAFSKDFQQVATRRCPGIPAPGTDGRYRWGRTVCAFVGSALLAVAPHVATAGDDTWRELRAPHFTVAGNAPERSLRQAAEDLEALDAALATLDVGHDVPHPTRVVIFENRRQFTRFLPRDEHGRPQRNVSGFFLPYPDTNFIVFGDAESASDRRVVLHEYAHHVLRRSVRALPLWLNEGLAEVCSTFDHDSTLAPGIIGRPPADVIAVLRRHEFVPLSRILAQRARADLLSDAESARVFYAESWALVHYLLIGRRGASGDNMGAVLDTLAREGQAEDALTAVSGMTLDELDRELRKYVRQEVFRGLPVDLGPHQPPKSLLALMPSGAVAALEGELLLRVGTLDEAHGELTTALSLDPSNVDARVAMARVLIATGRRPEGRAILEQVVATVPDHFAAQYYLGGILGVERNYDRAFWCFDAAVRARPTSVSALYAFSSVALALGLDDAAEEAMQVSMRLEFNPEAYRARAYAALGLRRDSAAAQDALRYIGSVGIAQPAAQETALVAAVAYWRSSRPAEAAAILGRVRAAAATSSWMASVVDYMQGRTTAAQFLARAKDLDQRTLAHTYIGLTAALAGQTAEALLHFRWVTDAGDRREFEYGVAIEELVRIELAERR